MKLPKKIKIGAHEIKVLYPYVFKDDGRMLGRSEWGSGSVKISSEASAGVPLSTTATLQVFLHEIIHMLDYVCGTNLFDGSVEADSKIDVLSEVVLQILVDNKFIDLKDFE